MKSITAKILLLFLILAFPAVTGCTAEKKKAGAPVEKTTAETQAKPDSPSPEKVRQMKEKIARAIAEAKRTGKTKVDVYLDEDPAIVQPRDLVTVRYTAVLEDGTLISGTTPVTRQLIAGQPDRMPGLGQGVVNMAKGESKKVIVPPEKAFGTRADAKAKIFKAVHVFPLAMALPADQYKKQFKTLPEPGQTIRFNPYFLSRVLSADDQKIEVRNLAENGQVEEAPFGRTTLLVSDTTITVTLAAKKGARFKAGRQTGTIIFADEDKFVVDFNHPLAGRTIILDVEILDFSKASSFSGIDIQWIDDHDRGLEEALKLNKPKVMVLYADWCTWCEKMFDQTFTDPRLKVLKDKFVWVKANSDKDPSLKAFYQQRGFPMVVITDHQGNILKKEEGYKDAAAMAAELARILNLKPADAQN